MSREDPCFKGFDVAGYEAEVFAAHDWGNGKGTAFLRDIIILKL